MIRLRAETPFTSQLLQSSTPPSGTPPLLPIPLTTPSPPLLLPSTIFRAGVSQKMAPKKRTTRASPAITTTTTTPVTNAQLKALIDQGVANALAVRDIDRSMNGDDNHNSGIGVRRQAPLARECTYPDFMKCKPLYFKGTQGVFELT
ncbi:hypothetical protein Tco_1383401 [Tanacetum coccineum]